MARRISKHPMWLLLICLVVRQIWGHGSGAPATVCQSMVPNHGLDVQDTESPFSLSVSNAVEKTGGVAVVTIMSPPSQSFQGFFLQARDANDKSKIVPGKFSLAPLTRHQDCAGATQNTLTHESTAEKGNVTSVWRPPPNFNGKVIFRATVAKTFDVYWTNLETVSVNLKSNALDVNIATVPTISTKSTFTPTVTASTSSNVSKKDDRRPEKPEIPNQQEIYDVCGKTKGCFGMPTTCVGRRNCDLLLTYIPQKDGVAFELIATLDNGSDYWISVGISEDKNMGDDTVTECWTSDGKTAVIRQSWNEGNFKKRNKVLVNSHLGISGDLVQYNGGVLSCRWNRQFLTNVEGVTFNLKENNYHLLLAKGLIRRGQNAEKIKHNHYLQSQDKVNLTRISVVAGKPNYLVKIHGAFMVVAWIGIVSVSILLARHYKIVWENKTICGSKVWFFCHRSMMLLAVSMIIAAFVVIFVHVDGWSQVAPNPHPILGCISTGLAVIQPIMATFRPSPTASNRYIFNWLHWFVGNVGQILAIVTMYFAVELSAVSLSFIWNWVLSAFVAFHFIFHIIMQLHTFLMERKVHPDIQMRDLNQKSPEFAKDAPGSGFRRFMLGIYITVNAGLVTALVLMVCIQQ